MYSVPTNNVSLSVICLLTLKSAPRGGGSTWLVDAVPLPLMCQAHGRFSKAWHHLSGLPALQSHPATGCRTRVPPSGNTAPLCAGADVRVGSLTRRLSAHTEGICAHLTGPRCSYQWQQPSPVPEGDIWPQGCPGLPAGPVGLSPDRHREGACSQPSFLRTLCWAVMTQLSFGADRLSAGSPITWFCLHSMAPSCQPRGDCGKTEGGREPGITVGVLSHLRA